MTSGVYQLTFSSGARYIGKSIDIENRWRQHADKLKKVTAAQNMQQEYNRCGMPGTEILFACHPDHIDLVEAVFIARNRPELNATRPADPFPGVSDLTDLFGAMGASTLDHINEIYSLSDKYINSQTEVTQLNEKISKLEKARTQKELDHDVGKRISRLSAELEEAKSSYTKAVLELKYHRQPWWQKMFA
jgi:hypothetical protein